MNQKLSLKTKALDSIRRVFIGPPLEAVLLRIARGTIYGGMWSRFIPGPHLYEHGDNRRVRRNGIEYELDPSCLMQWYVYWDLRERQRDRLYSLVNKGDVVLDVGTNVGETLLNFARITGEGGFVFGFEPDPDNHRNAQKNVSLNRFSNIRIFNLGVSDKRERVKLYRVDSHNLGMNRILPEEEASVFDDFAVIETDTLDEIVSNNKIGSIDLIKIDIEGYEVHAVRGALETLKRDKPKLFIEVGYTRLIKNGTSPTELIRLLTDLDYRIYHSETDEEIDADFDFAPFGEGGIDIYAVAR